MDFADRIVELRRQKKTLAVLGVDPQLDSSTGPGVPQGLSLTRFCCGIIESCAEFVLAIKPQLAFFEARGIDGLKAFREVVATGKRLSLPVIADAKRGDIGSTSAAYAEAFLGDGDFASDAVTVNPYLGSDAFAPFVARVKNHRGVFILVKNSNPSSGEFQDVSSADGAPMWELVARRVAGWGDDFIGKNGISSVGAVIAANYPAQAKRARELMPNALILVPGYGAQGAGPADAVAAARPGEPAILVSSSRGLMYAFANQQGKSPADAARDAAREMRDSLNEALSKR